MQIMFKHKKHGDMLLSAVLSALVFIMLAGSFFTLFSGQFTRIQAGRTAMQAEQYAEIDANTLRLLSYDDLDSKGAHARQGITSVADADGWQDEIVVGAEKTIDADTESKQRIATIKIYKTGDTLSRYSLQVPLSSQGSGTLDGEIGDTGWTKLPNGLILQWGIIHAPYTSSSIIVFPKEFPHKVLNVEVSMLGGIGSWGTQWIMSTGNWSSTSAYVTVIDNCNIPQISWFALGY